MVTDASSPSGIRIFVSYGRRDAREFVDKLVADLARVGFEVWRDTDALQAPHPWDVQIQNALKDADVVISVLTPHAVRTGGSSADGSESVCLDELAFARFRQPPTPIVPILVLQCDPPFVIYRLQYIDFLGTLADAACYSHAFDELVRTVKAVAGGALPKYRTQIFEPLDFDLYLRAKTRDFVGREWLLEMLLRELNESDSTAIILVAAPGMGKSAFAGHLFGTNPDGQLLAAHFCRVDRADSIDPRRFIESLIGMTSIRLPAYEQLVNARQDECRQLLKQGRIKEAFERLYLEPLTTLDPAGLGRFPRFLLLDAADEAETANIRPSIVELLAQTIELFPPWLRLVATTRDRASILDQFGAATILQLDNQDARNRADVLAIVNRILGQKDTNSVAPERPATTEICTLITEKADGNMLCAVQLCLALRRSGMDEAVIATLPRGLIALYRAIFQRRFDNKQAEWGRLRAILELVIVTRAPFPIALAAQALGDAAEYVTRESIESIADLLNIHNDTVRLFHYSLSEFLSHPGSPFFVNAAQGATCLLDLVIDEAAFAALTESQREFCQQNLYDWLMQCRNLQKYATTLPQPYDHCLFSRPTVPLLYHVGGVEVDEQDRQLIAHMVASGLAYTAAEVVDLALTRATERFRNSGASPWISELGRQAPEEEESRKISRAINMSFAFTCFALGWAKILGDLAPQARSRLVAILNDKDASALNWLIGWLDVAVGSRVLGISGYFEDQAGAIRSDWSEIEAELARTINHPAG
jgi:hypothetical protein